jgi:hypothetical protein
MLEGVFLKIFSRLASKKFNNLFGERGKVGQERLIVKAVDQYGLLGIASNLVPPLSEYSGP